MENILEINGLTVAFRLEGKAYPVTQGMSFAVRKGEILGVVGESGSGKSVTAKSVLRLLPSPPSSVLEGEILYHGEDILKMDGAAMRAIRGNRISMIFQEPMTSLDPLYTCGEQIVEALRLHRRLPAREAMREAERLLSLVGISMPEKRLANYPHELSGGMCQRVMIAMALCCNPELLIADEPTTALDPTIQAQILELIKAIQANRGMSVLYITHDLGVVAELCDRVVVVYAGMVMEIATVSEIFENPLHPYTLGLMHAMPRLGAKTEALYNIPGMVPHITQMPEGCRFHPRCRYAAETCALRCPGLTDAGGGHMVRCWNYRELAGKEQNDAQSF